VYFHKPFIFCREVLTPWRLVGIRPSASSRPDISGKLCAECQMARFHRQ
jgi:hypothetical protein